MSWSYRIVLLYVGFMGIILSLVFTCFGEKIELESKDYYAKELVFQEQIDATRNAKELVTPITHEVKGRTVVLNLPKKLLTKEMTGEIYFFRPSDSSLDKTIKFKGEKNETIVIDNPSLASGVYKMRVSIRSNNTHYYKEEVIRLK